MPCIYFDTFMERVGVHFSAFYFGKRIFPHPRHFNVCYLLVPDDVVNGKTLFGRDKVLFLPDDILAGKKRFDNGCPCCGRADTRIFHAGFQVGIFQFLTRRFH